MTRGLFVFGAALVLVASPDAYAQGIGETCSNSYEQAQQLRSESALIRSRTELRLCASTCPAALARDCQTWLTEVERELPSVALSATSADGRASGRVRVLIDGAPLVEAIPKDPVEVDPGRHTLTFEDAAGTRVEALVTLVAGDKALPIAVRFPAPAPAPAPALAPAPERRRQRWPLVLLGAGAVGLGVGAVLGIKGQLDRSHLRDTCAPRCAPAEIDAIDSTWTAGAIIAGSGLLLSGLGTALYFQLSPVFPAAPATGVSLAPGGAWLSFSGAF